MKRVRHLYLHVPFCRRVCPYCDYPVIRSEPDLARWEASLRRELEMANERGVDLSEVKTILVGGGTPSALGREAMRAVRGIVGERPLSMVQEWTAEANPEDVDPSLLEGWVEAGVTRLNLGVQSLNANALRWLGRLHDVEGAVAAMRLAARSPLASWGVDVLYGLPEAVETDPVGSLRRIVDLAPPHVSLYELAPEPGTQLGADHASGRARLPDQERIAERFLELGEVLQSSGYEHYEMTGFARPGHRCRHTVAALEGRSWLGLGPGAHSRVGPVRTWNLADWGVYLKAVEDGRLPRAEAAETDSVDDRADRLQLRLRLAEGVPLEALGPAGPAIASRWVREGWAHPDTGTVRLTPEGWLVLDGLSREIARVFRSHGWR